MKFKEGDRVRVLRFSNTDVDFYGTLKHVDEYMANLFDCTNRKYDYTAVFLPSDDGFGEDKEDYYVLAEDEENKRTINDLDTNAYKTKLVTEDEEDTEESKVQFSEEMWRQAGKNLESFENAFNNECEIEQRTEPLDKGEIIAQSIIDNRDGSSFLSNHEMIIWLNEIEEMHGENISVKGWHLILDYIKESIAPSFFEGEIT